MIAAVKVSRAVCALLTSVALCAGNAAYAQPRPGLPDNSDRMLGEPSLDEIAGSTRCRPESSLRLDAPEDYPMPGMAGMYDDRRAWLFAARYRICIESVRSDAVALAWSQGLDEHGVVLDADARASQLAEMEDWLRRLVGRFRIEGKRWNPVVQDWEKTGSHKVLGTADCFGIGSGPGVSCVIAADWNPDEGKKTGIYTGTAIRPQLLLFGLDPDAMQIRVTHVDAIAVEMYGFLHDGVVILNERTLPEVLYRAKYKEDDYGFPTRRLSRIAMTPGGEIDMKFYVAATAGGLGPAQKIEFDLQWHREPQADASRQGDEPSALADVFSCAKPVGSGRERMADDLEKLPAGVEKESGTRAMLAWLERLVGQYSVEGHVDLCGNGNPQGQRPVSGHVDCIAGGSPPSVHCKVDVNWPPATGENGEPIPGGVSSLAPAQMLFSLLSMEIGPVNHWVGGVDKRAILVQQLDNRGIADVKWSEVVDDTFMSRGNCVDIPGECYRTTRIIAKPDSDEISMRVDVEMDGKRILRQSFVLRRELISQKSESSGTSSP